MGFIIMCQILVWLFCLDAQTIATKPLPSMRFANTQHGPVHRAKTCTFTILQGRQLCGHVGGVGWFFALRETSRGQRRRRGAKKRQRVLRGGEHSATFNFVFTFCTYVSVLFLPFYVSLH